MRRALVVLVVLVVLFSLEPLCLGFASCHDKEAMMSGLAGSVCAAFISLLFECVGSYHRGLAGEFEPAARQLEHDSVAWVTIEDDGCDGTSFIDERG